MISKYILMININIFMIYLKITNAIFREYEAQHFGRLPA